MRSKTLVKLWIATGALLSFAVVAYFVREIRDFKRMPEFLKGVKESKDITALKMERLGETIELEKKDGQWYLVSPENYPAQENVVTEIVTALLGSELEERISTRPDRFADYELDDARSIRFWAQTAGGKTAAAGKLGKQVPGSWDRSYFSPENTSDIYIVRGLPRYSLDKRLSDFKSRLILSAPQDKISSIQIESGASRLAVRYESGSWKVNGKAAKEDKIKEIVGMFAALEANDFAEPQETALGLKKLGLEKKAKEALVRIAMTDGKSYELWIGDKKDALYFARLAGQPTIWKLAEWKVTPLKVKEKDLTAAKKAS